MSKFWDAEKDAYLKENYRFGNIENVANHFGKSVHSVCARACRLGISSGRYLDKRELAYFEKKSYMSNGAIANALGRDSKAVRKMRMTYGFGTVLDCNENMYTLAEIGRMMGKCKSTVSKCWVKAGLKTRRNGKYVMVSRENLIEFLQEHPEKWSAMECEDWHFADCDWFKDKKKKETERMLKKRWGLLV